jgi:hypothetical protein
MGFYPTSLTVNEQRWLIFDLGCMYMIWHGIDEQYTGRGMSGISFSVIDFQILIYCMQEGWWEGIETLEICCCGWVWRKWKGRGADFSMHQGVRKWNEFWNGLRYINTITTCPLYNSHLVLPLHHLFTCESQLFLHTSSHNSQIVSNDTSLINNLLLINLGVLQSTLLKGISSSKFRILHYTTG